MESNPARLYMILMESCVPLLVPLLRNTGGDIWSETLFRRSRDKRLVLVSSASAAFPSVESSPVSRIISPPLPTLITRYVVPWKDGWNRTQVKVCNFFLIKRYYTLCPRTNYQAPLRMKCAIDNAVKSVCWGGLCFVALFVLCCAIV